MEIRGLLQFEGGRIDSLTLTPNEKKEATASLKLSAALTPELAEKMRCREAVFREDGKPHSTITRLDLGGSILRDIDLSLPSPFAAGAYDVYRPEDIASFRVSVNGMVVRLHMLARIKNKNGTLSEWLEVQNTERFEFSIRAAQEEFDFSGKVSGTPVNLSGDKDSGEAVAMAGSIASAQEILRDIPQLQFEEPGKREPVVADMREVGIRRDRKGRTRGESGVDHAEIQKSMQATEDESVFPVN